MANNYKVKMVDLQNKYKFKIFCSSQMYDDTDLKREVEAIYKAFPKASATGTSASLNGTAAAIMNIDLKGNTSQETTTGKNLFKNFPDTKSVHSITMTNDGETISISGTNSSSSFYPSFVFYADGSVSVLSWYPTASNIDTTKGFFTESGTQYLFSMLKSGTMTGDSATYIIGKETAITSLSLYNSESTFTNAIASNSEKINFIAIGFKPSQQVDITLKMQIEKGNARTDYEPYTNGASPNPDYPQDVKNVTGDNTITIANSDDTESQSYNVNLGTLELCKIGNYQDYIYKEGKKWYKYNAIKKLILNGSENWSIQATWSAAGDKTNVFYISKPTDLDSGKPSYCDYLKYDSNVAAFLSTDKFGLTYSASLIVRMPKSLTNGEALQNWLRSNNMTLYYVLTTPTTEEITDATLISQLNALQNAMSYEGQTNISQTNSDEAFIITATAIKDLSNL